MKGYNVFGLISVLFILILSPLSAVALQENFDVSSQVSNIVACSNGVTTNSFVVTNNGDIESSYTLKGAGNIPFTYSESSFLIKAGQSKTVYLYYSPGNLKGDYYSQTEISTAFGMQKVISQNINVQNCQNLLVSVNTPSLTSNPCQPSQFSFNVRNTGDHVETYDFGSSGLEGFTTLSTNEDVLLPGETKQIDLFANPSCDVYGQKELTFQALAKSSGYLAEAHVSLNIERNYDYSVSLPSQINICNLKQVYIPVTITNFVPFTNQYDISVRGPSFLKQEARSVELGAYASGITNIVAFPQNPGAYTLTTLVNSVRGTIVKGGSQNITVEKCYSTDVNIENPSDIIVSGHNAKYPVTIKNDGTKDDVYTFELNGPLWTSLDASKLVLKSGESKTINLNANPAANITGNYNVIVRAISSDANYAKEDVIALKVASPQEAYNLKISPSHTRILYGQDVVNVNLQNNGLLPATYSLTLNGPSFMKLTQNSITLQPKEKETVYVQSNTNDKNEEANYETQIIAGVAGDGVGFVNKFIVSLRQLTIGQELQLFVTKYLIFIIIAGVVLLILIFIAIFGRKIARRWRNWRAKKNELAKIRAEVKARKREEKLAKKLLKKALKAAQPKNTGKKIFGIFLVIFALLVLSGLILTIAGYAPFVNELFKAKSSDVFAPIIKVNTTGLEAYGNSVIIRGQETNIPVMVKNNYNDNIIFDVQVANSWIQSDVKQIELEPNEQETINLLVSPENTTKGLYKISVSATLEKDNKVYNEDITINVKQKNLLNDFLSYVWYVVGGLIALVIGIFLLRKVKFTRKKVALEDKSVFNKIKYKTIKTVNIEIPKKK